MMQRILSWLGGLVLVVIVLFAGAIIYFRFYFVPHLAQQIFNTQSPATATPEKFGVAYTPVKLKSGQRTLRAWRVDAGPKTPAALIFHGNSETIRDWARVQAYLFHHGVSSMVFDYTGFGKSTGKPTIDHLNQDAVVAYRVFVKWVEPRRPKFVVAHSLGTAVALHNAPSFKPPPLGIVTYGTFNTAKDLMIYLRGIPPYAAPLVPDIWDNVRAAVRIKVPLLVLAGSNDVNVPPIMGRQVALYAGGGRSGQFEQVWGANHASIATPPLKRVWTPIFKFMRKRTTAAHWSGPAIKLQATVARP
jgi:alpha-beta hydrolase superfamily lysophospholipase